MIALYDFVISPEPFVEKIQELGQSKETFSGDAFGLGISYDMLEEAVSESGGTIDANDLYLINDAICLSLLLSCKRASGHLLH